MKFYRNNRKRFSNVTHPFKTFLIMYEESLMIYLNKSYAICWNKNKIGPSRLHMHIGWDRMKNVDREQSMVSRFSLFKTFHCCWLKDISQNAFKAPTLQLLFTRGFPKGTSSLFKLFVKLTPICLTSTSTTTYTL